MKLNESLWDMQLKPPWWMTLLALSWREFFFLLFLKNEMTKCFFLFIDTQFLCIWMRTSHFFVDQFVVFFFLLRNSENTKIKIHTYTQGGGGGWWNVVNIFFFFQKKMTGWKWRRDRLWYTVTHITRLNLFWKKKNLITKKNFFVIFFNWKKKFFRMS